MRSAREPMLAQMRLAWWRDRLNADISTWPKGEPLLARLADWGDAAGGLAALVDGWEALLGDAPLAGSALAEFARGRAGGVAALAARHGADAGIARAAAMRWALADLALHLGDPHEKAAAHGLLNEADPAGKVGGTLRPLAILAGLSERAVRTGASEALSGPGALLAAIRLGIIGR
ncbi:hypothetical protein [Novosphingobium flavum]|uniref:hypothetical protein n=1 Tax=Novosphingobium flavum TaxID=1778672 RepID=UPI0031B5E08B